MEAAPKHLLDQAEQDMVYIEDLVKDLLLAMVDTTGQQGSAAAPSKGLCCAQGSSLLVGKF